MGWTRTRWYFAGIVLWILSVPFAPVVAASQPDGERGAHHPILDQLATATPDSTFSVFGSTGSPISATQYRGPMFVLDRPTMITEVGAFVNNCRAIVGGVPDCPDTQPFVVEIRPAVDGSPDPTTVVARLLLSHDADPLTVSYEFAQERIHLPAGTYFALIGPSAPGDEGFLLESAVDPVSYLAGAGMGGVIDPADPVSSSQAETGFQAVRIMAVGRGN